MKALIVGEQSYAQLLSPFMDVCIFNPLMYSGLDKYDVVMFTGGADIDPALYGEPRHGSTTTHPLRDEREVAIYELMKHKAKFIGICRGAQLLCALNGDRVVQDVTNHLSCDHDIFVGPTDSVEAVINVTGDHHQMMCPDKGDVLAYALGISEHYLDGTGQDKPYDTDGGVEPEVVWYEDTESLCVQYHPEWMPEQSEGRLYFNELVQEYIL